MTQTYSNCAETHLDGGVMSSFVSPLSAIDRAHDPTLIGSVSLRKTPRRFCPHCSDRCHVLMLMCRKSPLWQHCERRNNVLSSFWPQWLDRNEQRGHHVTCALIGTSRKLAAYNYASSLALERRLSTSWWIQTEVSIRSEQSHLPGVRLPLVN